MFLASTQVEFSVEHWRSGVRKIQVVLCGYYGHQNGGDEALLASLLQMLPESVTPLVLSGDPVQTSKQYGVEACDRRDPLAVIQALRASEALIWGGGSLIQDVTSLLSPLYYSGLMGLAQRLGLKTIAWAQGIGPLKRRGTRWLAQQIFRGCTAVSVRDAASATLLSNWHVPCVIAPDPVWALESVPVAGLWNLPAPRVAVALRSHPLLTPARLTNLTQALVDFQTATQTCVLLIPFQPVQDRAIAESIQPHLPGPSQILHLDDPKALKGVFRGVEMAIAMRFHGLIMAATEECRCFAISYDPKVSQLMHELSLPGWELADLPDDPNLISQTWLEHYVNGDALSAGQIQSLVDRTLMHQDLLEQVLGGR